MIELVDQSPTVFRQQLRSTLSVRAEISIHRAQQAFGAEFDHIHLFEFTRDLMQRHLGDPVMQGRDPSTGFLRINPIGTWNILNGPVVMMTPGAAAWIRLITDVFEIKNF